MESPGDGALAPAVLDGDELASTATASNGPAATSFTPGADADAQQAPEPVQVAHSRLEGAERIVAAMNAPPAHLAFTAAVDEPDSGGELELSDDSDDSDDSDSSDRQESGAGRVAAAKPRAQKAQKAQKDAPVPPVSTVVEVYNPPGPEAEAAALANGKVRKPIPPAFASIFWN